MSSLLKTIFSYSRGYAVAASKLVNSARPYTNSTVTTPVASTDDEPIQMDNPFEKDKMKCVLCELDITPDYKNIRLLSQFQSPYTGRIYGRHVTGLCKQKQEEIEKEIIKAQGCGIMPTYHKDPEFLQDPKLFDPERPIRQHKY